MRKGRDVGCLCLTCENLEQIRRGQVSALKILRYIILDWESELDRETQKRNVSEDAVLYNKQLQKSISATKNIRSILSFSSKFDMIW